MNKHGLSPDLLAAARAILEGELPPALKKAIEKKKEKEAGKNGDKPKMDPVGKKDGDVDNDGDKDSSDEYLQKRRDAIAANMKDSKKKTKTVGEAKAGYCSDDCCGADVKADDCTCSSGCKACDCNSVKESIAEATNMFTDDRVGFQIDRFAMKSGIGFQINYGKRKYIQIPKEDMKRVITQMTKALNAK